MESGKTAQQAFDELVDFVQEEANLTKTSGYCIFMTMKKLSQPARNTKNPAAANRPGIPTWLKKSIIEAAGKNLNLPHYRIFYFGSTVTGLAKDHSDIDVGIESTRAIPLAAISQMKTSLDDLPILRKIDLVDFTRVSPGFKKIARKKIKVIYEK